MAEGLFYSAEVNVQLLIQLMKAHGIRKVILSPGATNIAFSGSIRQDPYFELYSSVDERSAAYMACGMAAESGEPVALSCTGATAARNYMPGLTEAFYRKLPVLAITSSPKFHRLGNLYPQFTDRTNPPPDVVKTGLFLPLLNSGDALLAYTVKVNAALLELRRNGGGPVHINLETAFTKDYSVQKLPDFRVIKRYTYGDALPNPKDFGKTVAIMVGSHAPWSAKLTAAVDAFCEKYNGLVLCDQTSNYNGKYKILLSLLNDQKWKTYSCQQPGLMIHIGEISGAYFKIKAGKLWRVNPDGELRNYFRTLQLVFQMSEEDFFAAYAENSDVPQTMPYYEENAAELKNLREQIPDMPLSNVWLAKETAHRLPKNSSLHLGILNSLRTWNYFECDPSITRFSNVGGFGIDGCASTVLGASLAAPEKLFFLVIGDLAFFYDMNALGNRYVGKNIRILLVNNGRGVEFRIYSHYAARFGEDADPFIAAAGHFGNQSPDLVRHYAQDLGFEYLTASTKEEYLQQLEHFVSPEKFDKPILFEVFTNTKDESNALRAIRRIVKQPPESPAVPAPKPTPAPKPAVKPVPASKVETAPQPVIAPPKTEPVASVKKFELRPMNVAPVAQKKIDLIPSKKARLGFGVMRLPRLTDGSYDMPTIQQMVDEYMKSDFRYFDMHPGYCKRQSQSIVRELVVKRYPRESFLLADKMPWPIKAASDYERIFSAELKDCGVEYFDYYLLHALAEQYYQMHERFGGFEFLKKLKAQGLVRRIGFSFHDKPDVLEKILSAHPEIDFVQLQINYLDWEDPFFQARKLYEVAKKFGKQITVMEPIRGGALANLEDFKIPGGMDKATFARTALRFVASLDVSVILSGMSEIGHVVENRKTLEDIVTLTDDDKKIYPQILDALKSARVIPCTACRYCVAECPKKIPIPDILALMNSSKHKGEYDLIRAGLTRNHYRRYFFDGPKASDCIACGACARRCPQRIPIPEHMREAAKLFEGQRDVASK